MHPAAKGYFAQDPPQIGPGSSTTGGGGGGWAQWLPIVGSVAGAVIGAISQDRSNKANAKAADKQMAFQERMANTSYQRGTADMIAAGLNPALAYKQGGADSGSGAAAESRAITTGERLAMAVDQYSQFATATAQREVLRQQAAATAAQARKTVIEGDIMLPERATTSTEEYRTAYHRGRITRLRSDEAVAAATPERFAAETGQVRQATSTARAQEKLIGTQATLNEQEFMNEWFRKNIAPYINSTARSMKGVHALRGAKGSFD